MSVYRDGCSPGLSQVLELGMETNEKINEIFYQPAGSFRLLEQEKQPDFQRNLESKSNTFTRNASILIQHF